ncbi:MAG: hypothetical protein HOM44_07185 [Gammaproteobacteria bacterium]|nr:hypothetical protein [Gammaproteobacteria bacterium]
MFSSLCAVRLRRKRETFSLSWQKKYMAYSFEIDDQWGLLTLVHWGELVGAETDEAILSVLAKMPLLKRRKIIRIGIDWRKVDAATLQDTDGARVRNSAQQLKQLLEFTSEEYDKHLEAIKFARWIDPRAPVSEVLIERLNRVDRTEKFDYSAVCTTQEHYLRLLNLPPNFDISG